MFLRTSATTTTARAVQRQLLRRPTALSTPIFQSMCVHSCAAARVVRSQWRWLPHNHAIAIRRFATSRHEPGSKAAYRAAQRAQGSAPRKAPRSSAVNWTWAAGAFLTVGVGLMVNSVYQWYHVRHTQTKEVADREIIDGNPIVYMDLAGNGEYLGRVLIQLRADVCPVAAENLRMLLTHENGYGFRMMRFHDTDSYDALKGGDWITADGGMSVSVYKGGRFHAENHDLYHDGPGLITMLAQPRDEALRRRVTASALEKMKDTVSSLRAKQTAQKLAMYEQGEQLTLGSQFGITLKALPEWNGTHVVVGNVVEGMDVIFKVADTQNQFKNVMSRSWIFQRADPVDLRVLRCGQLGWAGTGGPRPIPDGTLPPLASQRFQPQGSLTEQEVAELQAQAAAQYQAETSAASMPTQATATAAAASAGGSAASGGGDAPSSSSSEA